MLNRFAVAIPVALAGTILLFYLISIGMPAALRVALSPFMAWAGHLNQGERRILAYTVCSVASALGPAIIFGIRAYRGKKVNASTDSERF